MNTIQSSCPGHIPPTSPQTAIANRSNFQPSNRAASLIDSKAKNLLPQPTHKSLQSPRSTQSPLLDNSSIAALQKCNSGAAYEIWMHLPKKH